jgi:hypothetical protein
VYELSSAVKLDKACNEVVSLKCNIHSSSLLSLGSYEIVRLFTCGLAVYTPRQFFRVRFARVQFVRFGAGRQGERCRRVKGRDFTGLEQKGVTLY